MLWNETEIAKEVNQPTLYILYCLTRMGEHSILGPFSITNCSITNQDYLMKLTGRKDILFSKFVNFV